MLVSRRAVTLVEVVVGLLIFTVLFIPAYALFIQSRDAAFKSKLSYLAAQAARDEIEDLRILTRTRGHEIDKFEHDWAPVKGNALDRLKEYTDGSPVKELDFPADYSRIFTKVDIGESRVQGKKNEHVFPAVLHVRWQEHGERFKAGSEKDKPGLSRFDFFLVRPRRGI